MIIFLLRYYCTVIYNAHTAVLYIIHHNISLDIVRLKNCRKRRPTSQLVVPIIKSAKCTRHGSAETTTIASVNNNMACECVLF